MTAYNGLVITSHIIAFLGFLSLYMTGNTGGILFTIATAAVLYSSVCNYRGKEPRLPSELSTFAGTLVVLYLAAGFFFMEKELFVVLVHFLVFIQIIKLLGKKDIPGYRQIIILGFFQFLSVTVSTTEITYGLIMLLFLILITAGIIFHTICSGDFYNELNNREIIAPGSFLKTLIPAVLLILIFSSVVFVSMPRFRKNFITASMIRTNQLESGFTDRVDLGQVGEIKKDNTPVMRVKLYLPEDRKITSGDLYWRGITYNEFDGKSWSFDGGEKRVVYGSSEDIVFISKDEGSDDLVKQEIITEPLRTSVLFAADRPAAFQSVPFNRLREINDSQFTYSSVSSKKRYIAYSDIKTGNTEKSVKNSAGKYPPEITHLYLSNIYRTDSISKLADELYDPSAEPYTNVTNVEDYLRHNLNYSRTIEYEGEGFPVEQFLFDNRKGHCEYFATSMVVLLRNMGIPSRMVTGFMGGDYNSRGEFYTVRQSHAHAWVEVYFKNSGWIRFDPTPSDTVQKEDSSFADSFIELIKYRWNRYIVDFDSYDQKRLVNSVKNRADGVFYNLAMPDDIKQKELLIPVIFVAIFIISGFVYTIRGKVFIKNRLPQYKKATLIYNESLKSLEKHGLKKRKDWTPREFSRYVTFSLGSEYDFYEEFTRLYLASRYARVPDPGHIEKMREFLRILKNRRK